LSGSDLTRGAAEVVALGGVTESFAQAANTTIRKMSGLRVGESTVEQTTELAGAAIGRALADGRVFGPAIPWNWSIDAEGKTCGFISADLTGVRIQGLNGAKADGRMVAVGMIYNPGVEHGVRYVAGLDGGLAALSQSLRQQGAQVGLDQAQRWIAISDGGAGIEDWLRTNFPRVEAVILDFYHVAEHLNKWAKAWYRDDEEAKRVASEWCHTLKHDGGAKVLAGLEQIDARGKSATAREAYREVLGYFRNHVARMDYPSYRAKGWAIGSGPVEAACKVVVGQRLCGSGMRWGEEGAGSVAHLRALYRSGDGQWDACWATLAV
jgi:hypothetical protein